MFSLLALSKLSLASALSLSTAVKPCEELKKEIAEKLDAKGVKGYTLDVMAKADVKDGMKVVGTCDGGTKAIVYARGK
jgi:hypothetical protein